MRPHRSRTIPALAVLLGWLGTCAPVAVADVLAPEIAEALTTSPYVYVATQRKDGSFGTPSEIWFMYDQGAVWMASPTTAWRVRRIRTGRTTARIAVGTKDGPTFTAKGSFVRDPAAYERLYATYAKKYPQGWPQYEARFRDGLKNGSRVLMRYDAIAAPAAKPSPAASPTSLPSP
jgi:predicted pyridoxine 5'-phosphate oxidase superfamily flavin-nucleotide-binding protein